MGVREKLMIHGRRITWLITLGSWMSFSSTQATSFSLNLLQHFKVGAKEQRLEKGDERR